MGQNGWQTLNTWLKSGKEDENQPFVQELLDLLLVCPVTVDRLKVTDTAKLVKALRKEGTNTDGVIERANRLYDKWLKVIGASHPPPPDATADVPLLVNGNSGSKVKKLKTRKNSVDVNDSSSNNSTDAALVANGGSGIVAGKQNGLTGNKAVKGPAATTTTTTDMNSPTITPSDLFMESLAPVLSETPKRKKRTSEATDSSSNKKTKTTTTASTSNPVTNDAASPAADPEDLLSHIIEQDMNVDKPVPQPITRSLSDIPVTPTSPLTVSSPLTLTPVSTPTSSRTANPNSLTAVDATPSQLMTPGPDKSYPRGCLHFSTSGKKKSVRWLPDESMTRVKFFDAGDDERVNVWRQSLQNQQNQNENKLAEGQAFRDKGSIEGSGEPKSIWMPLQPIEFNEPVPTFVRGRDSRERLIEAARQSTVLADIFISKDMIPDTPAEPPAEAHITGVSLAEAKLIPLEDPSGGTLTDHSKTPLPIPRNNPLSGDLFLKPHQMALDHNVVPMNPVSLPAGGGPVPKFQSSYVERPFTGANSHMPPMHPNGPMNQSNIRGPVLNGKNGQKPFLSDLRNSKGQKVCGFFYNTGKCYRPNCHFLHTREDVMNWSGNNLNNMQKCKQTV